MASTDIGQPIQTPAPPKRDWVAILVTALPGIAALIAVLITYPTINATKSQVQIARQGQNTAQQQEITDSYNAAITNLGSRSVDVRLGGIYALQRLMQYSHRDQPTVVAVLCAFVRDQSSLAIRPPNQLPVLGTDVQAALTVVGTRNPAKDGRTTVVDFSQAQLPNARLDHVSLYRANFYSADLTGASLAGNFARANFSYTDLTAATLTGNFVHADFFNSDLTVQAISHADFADADMVNADFRSVYLRYVDFAGANLSGANFNQASFSDGTNLARATFSSGFLRHATLNKADLRNAWLIATDLTGATLTGATLTGAHLSSANLTRADLTGAHLSHATLTGADLTGARLGGADFTGATLTGAIWPQNFPAPQGWVRDPSSGRLRHANAGA